MARSVAEARPYSPESLPDKKALQPYLTAPRLLEWFATKRLERFKKKHTNPDGSAKFHNVMICMRAQPWHWGHEQSYKAAESIIDPTGKVVIVIPDVGERNKDNPFTPEQCEEIIRELLESKGVPKDRYTFFHIKDVNSSSLWRNTILEGLRERGIELDAVISFNPAVTSPFENLEGEQEGYSTIDTINPPSIWRRRRQGTKIRRRLRKSGDLVP